MLHHDPHQYVQNASRWTLRSLGQACPWLQRLTRSGVWRVVQRLGVRWKRGKAHIHSPDPAYDTKRAYLTQIIQRVAEQGERRVLLYLDEMSLRQQPTVADAWEARGHHDPLAERSPQPDRFFRLIATLDAHSGQVVAWGRSHLRVATLVHFYAEVCAAYPQADRLYIVLDNWPVHFHPDLLAALEPQELPWPVWRPRQWPTTPSSAALAKWGEWHLPIQLVALPTYAPWLNPSEKLWRWLRQQVGHHHPWAQAWSVLKEAALAFLSQFAVPSPALLRYVGLVPP